MEVLQTFGFWDQEIDSGFMKCKPLIPTLHKIHKLLTICLSYDDRTVII